MQYTLIERKNRKYGAYFDGVRERGRRCFDLHSLVRCLAQWFYIKVGFSAETWPSTSKDV